MTNKKKIIIFYLFLMPMVIISHNLSRMKEMFNWKQIEFEFLNDSHRQQMIESGQFKPGNTVPTSISLYCTKMFITTPRFKLGVPSTLSFINVDVTGENTTSSPSLIPYPNWESHDIQQRNITSVLNIFIDPCERLWTLDSGQIEFKHEKDPNIEIYDLKTDLLLDSIKIKYKGDYKSEPFLSDILIDVTSSNCDSAYAYITDANNYEIIVYNMKTKEFHKLSHNYFHFDPLGGDLAVDNIHYQTQQGIFSLAMSNVGRDDHRSVFFTPLASSMQFIVSSRVLQNRSLDTTESFYEFKVMGPRGQNSQSCASVFDEETGVLFYTLILKNSIGCWNSFSGDEFTEKTQGIVVENANLIYPSDVSVDKNGLIWVLFNRLPKFLMNTFNPEDINIRILNSPIRTLIKGTPCDAM